MAAAVYRFRESLFLLPTLVVLGGIALAEACALVDRAAGPHTAVPLTLDITSNAATWLLSTVAGATITTAGVVFSLTVVSLQLASSQFSPRVMRSFIRDRLSQLVIGLLVATFVYCVLTLRHIGADEAALAPRLSMTVAVVLTVGTVMETRSGAYIHEGEPLVIVRPAPANPDEVRDRLSATVMVAAGRTMQQDIDFALRQLVDIGLRALSSAINDPTTAVEVTLRVGSLLRKLLVVDLPPEAVAGPEGRVLLRPWQLTHDEYIAHGFDQLRQAAPPQPQVVAALLRVLRMLIDHVERTGHTRHVPALRRQMRLLLESVDGTPGLHPDDLRRLELVADGSTDPADHAHRPGDPDPADRVAPGR